MVVFFKLNKLSFRYTFYSAEACVRLGFANTNRG